MRAGRLVSLLLLLQTRGRVTARDLAQRLEVSERTIYRDIEALSSAGVPVYATRGPGGGCALLPGFRTDLTGLTQGEAAVLFLLGFPLRDLGLGREAAAAETKLLAALPPALRADAQRARGLFHLDAPAWSRPPEPVPHLPALLDAVWNGRRADAVYARGDGTEVRRVIDPLGLVVKAGIWYVVAASGRGPVVYRVSRFRALTPRDDAVQRPDGFDLARFWSGWTEDFDATRPRMEVTTKVREALLAELPGIFGESIRAQVAAAVPSDGWAEISLTFESLEAALYRLLGLGTAVEVMEPLEVRDAVLRRASEVVSFYASAAREDVAVQRSARGRGRRAVAHEAPHAKTDRREQK